MKIIISTVFLSFIFFSCSNEKEIYSCKLIKTLSMYSDSTFVSKGIFDIEYYNNHFFISETPNNRIIVLNNQLEIINKIGSQGHAPHEFIYLSYFSIVKDTLYLFDAATSQIKVFDINGKYLRYFKVPSSIKSRKFAVDKNLSFYFSTPSDNYNITKTDLNGNVLHIFGEQIERYGKRQQLFNNIKNLFINDKQELIAVSNTTPIIEKYNLDGRLIKRIDLTVTSNIYKFDKYIESMVLARNSGKERNFSFIEFFSSATINRSNSKILISCNNKASDKDLSRKSILIIDDKKNNLEFLGECTISNGENDDFGWITSISSYDNKLIVADGTNHCIHFFNVNFKHIIQNATK